MSYVFYVTVILVISHMSVETKPTDKNKNMDEEASKLLFSTTTMQQRSADSKIMR